MCVPHVGRIGVPLADLSVARISLAGDRLRMDGRIAGPPEAVGVAAEQVRGLLDNMDEPFVPVWWERCDKVDQHLPGLARHDGFYHVSDAGNDFARLDWSVLSLDLQRVRGYSAPLFELRTLGALRAGSSGTPTHWHALPDATTGYEQGSITPTMTSRACEPPHPEIQSRALTVYRHAALADSRVDFYVPPSDWYLGAPSLQVDGHLVVGRQVRQSSDWLLSNGVIRAYQDPALTAIIVERWDGLGWVSAGRYMPGRPDPSAPEGQPRTSLNWMSAPHALTVLHNSAELVSIRLAVDTASMYPGSRFVVNLDLSLRRGSPYLEVTLSTRGAYEWGVDSHEATDGAVTSGTDYEYYATSRRLLSTNATNAWWQWPGAEPTQRVQWCWGISPPGESVATVYQQYKSAMAERVSVVAR